MDKQLNILIADDHDLVREGLKLALARLPEKVACLEAGSADAVLRELADSPSVSLVILDLHMPGSNGMELLTKICTRHPEIPVVILSADEDPQVMQRTIDRGAAGFIPKSAANEVLISAVQLVLSGGTYIPTEILNRKVAATPPGSGTLRNPVAPLELTGRQLDVLDLLSHGESNKAIARKLGLSEHTVKIHISAIFKALGVSNRTEAALAYQEARRSANE